MTATGRCLQVVLGVLRAGIAGRGLDRGGRHGPWAPWLRRSDDARVGWGMVADRWATTWGDRSPGANTYADQATRGRLRLIAETLIDPYVEQCGLAPAVGIEVLTRLASHGVRRTPGSLSELLASKLLTAYRELGRCPRTPAEVDAVVAAVVRAILGSTRPWGAEEFAEAAATEYDRLWAAYGAAILACYRPSAVGLGADVRSPLVSRVPRPGRMGGVALGTDRSVHERYVLHYSRKARSRESDPDLTDVAGPDGEEPDEHRPWPEDARERMPEELERVCSPYGLVGAEHHGVIVAVAYGTDLHASATGAGPAGWVRPGSWARWRRQTEPLRPLPPAAGGGPGPPDDGLVAAVRDLLEGWLHSDEVRLLAQRHGDLRGQADLIGAAIARKLWMDLHRREREHVAPARRTDVTRYLKVAVVKTVPDALARWSTGPEPAADPEQRRRTVHALFNDARSTPDGADRLTRWGEAIGAGDLELVRSEYAAFLARMAARGVRPDDLLPAEEFLDLLENERGDDSDAA